MAYQDELLDREVIEAQHLDLGPEAEPDDLPVIPCQWTGCDALFWEIEPLLLHLSAVHVDTQVPGKYTCEWQGCTRLHKPASNRSAIQAHLRSHTGERPYACQRPECDKLFPRMDALQKHSQSVHAESLAMTRKPPTKKRKMDDAASVADEGKREDPEDSGDETFLAPSESAPVAAGEEMATDDEQVDDAMAEVVARHPDQLPAFVQYIVTAAKHKYALSEHASLIDECDLLQGVEAELREEKDRLVEKCAIQAVGQPALDFFAQPLAPYGGLVAWQPHAKHDRRASSAAATGQVGKS